MAKKTTAKRSVLKQIEKVILFRGNKYYLYEEYILLRNAKAAARKAIKNGYKVRLIRLGVIARTTLLYTRPKMPFILDK